MRVKLNSQRTEVELTTAVIYSLHSAGSELFFYLCVTSFFLVCNTQCNFEHMIDHEIRYHVNRRG